MIRHHSLLGPLCALAMASCAGADDTVILAEEETLAESVLDDRVDDREEATPGVARAQQALIADAVAATGSDSLCYLVSACPLWRGETLRWERVPEQLVVGEGSKLRMHGERGFGRRRIHFCSDEDGWLGSDRTGLTSGDATTWYSFDTPGEHRVWLVYQNDSWADCAEAYIRVVEPPPAKPTPPVRSCPAGYVDCDFIWGTGCQLGSVADYATCF